MVIRIVIMFAASPVLSVLRVSAWVVLSPQGLDERGFLPLWVVVPMLVLRTAFWTIPTAVILGVFFGGGKSTALRRWLCFVAIAVCYIGACFLATTDDVSLNLLTVATPVLASYGLAMVAPDHA